MNSPISITNEAKSEVLDIMQNKGIPTNMLLRIGVKGAGCSGTQFYLGFDEKEDDDDIIEENGIQFLAKKKDFMHLLGVKLDFLDAEDTRGFVFKKD